MNDLHRCVIVGASLAGATTALTLRELGYDGEVVLVGGEPELPYERPALSKEYLLETMAAEQLSVRPRETYDDLRIELRLAVDASALDVVGRQVLLDDGQRLPYSTLVIATGSSNLRPPIPGIDRRGVHQLRTLADATAIRTAATAGSTAALVGMGFIGCEIASSLRQLGVEVTAVDGLSAPLLPQLGPELSERVRGWHEEHGVRLLFDRTVVDISAEGSRLAVETTSGDRVPADLVVVGVGTRPNVGWLAGTPLHLPGGVAVDADGRTNVAEIYAAGDVAASWSGEWSRHRRFEHWDNALQQGRRVAHTIVGVPPPESGAPYFWSAQYGHYLQYVGEHAPDAVAHTREVAPGKLTVFYLNRETIVAAATVDNGKDLRHARALVGRPVDPRLLVDPMVPLRELAVEVRT